MKRYSNFFAQVHTVIPSSMSGRLASEQNAAWQPLVDVYECDSGLVILVELPGLTKDDIGVHVSGSQIRISGTRPNRLPEAARNVHHMEIPFGAFARVLPLPEWADSQQIEAEYKDGYLTVNIPRK